MTDVTMAREFVPNTPCLVNAGKPNGQLAACFVLDVPDSIAGIMKTATDAAIIHQTGGGTGFTFEKLRPSGSMVSSTHGVASGPVSFMNIFNTTTDTVKQGGVRRGANMGMMRVTHPDILRFIHAKNDQHSLTNFNISVNVTDKFRDAIDRNEWYQLEFKGEGWNEPVFDPVTGRNYVVYRRPDGSTVTFRDKEAFDMADLSDALIEEPPAPGMVYAPDSWNRIIASAHRYAEPGIAFIDEVNRHNHMMNSMGPIMASNPCGEQFLHFANSCNLGSIDVAKFYNREQRLDWDRLAEVTHLCTRFLDNVIGISREVPLTPRNYEVTTIAPTGTISLVAETSSGVEPNFSWAYVRKDTLGTRTYVHTLAAQALGVDVDQTDADSIDAAAC